MLSLNKKVLLLYKSYIDPHKRVALSIRFPFLKIPIMSIHRVVQYMRWFFDKSYSLNQSEQLLPYIIKKHKSVLMRKLGSTDMALQENKKLNLFLAGYAITRSIIAPGKKRSFRQHIGLPTYAKGYQDGVLLYQGKVTHGVGGGICQMANMLYRLVLHSPLQVSKHYHHSYDVFPDSGRVLPFGSGATVVYNYVDLEFYNPTDNLFQFEIWQDDEFLYGNLRSDKEHLYSYKISEKNHHFISTAHGFFRYNELYNNIIDKRTGNRIAKNHIRTNFSPVLYELSEHTKNTALIIE